jgi:hypothetical protein
MKKSATNSYLKWCPSFEKFLFQLCGSFNPLFVNNKETYVTKIFQRELQPPLCLQTHSLKLLQITNVSGTSTVYCYSSSLPSFPLLSGFPAFLTVKTVFLSHRWKECPRTTVHKNMVHKTRNMSTVVLCDVRPSKWLSMSVRNVSPLFSSSSLKVEATCSF